MENFKNFSEDQLSLQDCISGGTKDVETWYVDGDDGKMGHDVWDGYRMVWYN